MKRGAARFGLLAVLCASAASAQTGQAIQPNSASQTSARNASTLRRRLGVEVAETLLKSQESEDRQRGFERLGSVGTAQALDLLVKSFDPGGAARSARDRLIAVRALAPHAHVAAVRELLVRVMVGVGTNPERSEPIDASIERAAALALAASGDDAAISALAKAIRQTGHVADTAEDALLAFPPRTLAPLLALRTAPTQTLVRVLERSGDPRAVPALRDIVRSAAPEVRADAAVALAKFGDRETIELARHWLEHEKASALRLAPLKILEQFRTPDAAPAIAKLLEADDTRAAALELASAVQLLALAPALLALAPHTSGDERSAVYAALAQTGTREAFSFLGGALGTRETSSAAALALALAPSSDAEAVLARALTVPSTRRVAARASVVRARALGSTPSGLASALEALARSSDPADTSTFFEVKTVLAPHDAHELVAHAKLNAVRAIARAALVPGVAEALAARLATETDPALRDALAACLVSPKAAQVVPNDVLLALLAERGLTAPLAARALAMRDSLALRPRIQNTLASEDWLMRSHTALGLGESAEPSALGLLERAYRFETDERVRLALVHALALRPEVAKKRTLSLAHLLDAAPNVRAAAALALAGATPEPTASGAQSAWLDFSAPTGGPPRNTTGAALVITAEGLAVPAFADPDGVLLVPALPAGEFSLRLVAEAGSDDARHARTP